MKVLRLWRANDFRLADEQLPELSAGDALVKVTAVGVCGSDLHWMAEGGIGSDRLQAPLVLGHEFAGTVETESGKPQLVAADPAIPCHACDLCRMGNPNLCLDLRFAGHSNTDGALREFMSWPIECLYPLPAKLTPVEGAMLEPLGVAIHAVDLVRFRPGMTAGVFGCGPIGLLLIQLLRLCGATGIVATDPLPHRREAALRYGASGVFEAEDLRGVVEAAGNRGVDVAFEAAGENQAVDMAVESVRNGGSVVLVGIPADDRTSFVASTARRKGLTVRVSRRMKHTYPRAIALVEAGRLELESLVTHRFSLDEYDRAFEAALNREGLKVIVDPSASTQGPCAHSD